MHEKALETGHYLQSRARSFVAGGLRQMPCWVDGIWMDTSRSTDPAFSRADRRRLSQALAQTRDVRLYRRLQAVAEIAAGEPVDEVAKRARVARSTVYRWLERDLAEQAPSALADERRSGRPRGAGPDRQEALSTPHE